MEKTWKLKKIISKNLNGPRWYKSMGSPGFIRSYCDVYTGLSGGLGHGPLKIEMRLRGERFENVRVEYAI